jgi:2-polyprenyl-3-methyl-5-hydroxy-6-metoxy-1,4-benzoquinol methylase
MGASGLQVFGGDATRCQLCGSSPLVEFVVPQSTTLWRCKQCGLFQNGRLVDNLAYADEYHRGYEHHRDKKLRTATVRLNRIAALVRAEKTPRLLDVGSSVGCVIEAALNRVWEAIGIDVSASAVEFCRKRNLPCRLVHGTSLPFSDASFDVLTAWHVIEHVEDVQTTLAEWYRVLRPDGVLALETPDASSPMVRLRGSSYRKFWAPEHTYTFTPATLSEFMRRAGFEILSRPVFGRLAGVSAGMAAYTVVYQGYQGLRKAAGISKAFQLFARRTSRPSTARRLAA